MIRDTCIKVLCIHTTRYGPLATKFEGTTYNQDLIRKGNPFAHAIEKRNLDYTERWWVRARRNLIQTLCEQGTNGRELYGLEPCRIFLGSKGTLRKKPSIELARRWNDEIVSKCISNLPRHVGMRGQHLSRKLVQIDTLAPQSLEFPSNRRLARAYAPR